MKIFKIVFGTTLLLFLICVSTAYSQGENGRGKGKGQPSIPKDGGASWLTAAGVVYGIKKYRDSRKSPKNTEAESEMLPPL